MKPSEEKNLETHSHAQSLPGSAQEMGDAMSHIYTNDTDQQKADSLAEAAIERSKRNFEAERDWYARRVMRQGLAKARSASTQTPAQRAEALAAAEAKRTRRAAKRDSK